MTATVGTIDDNVVIVPVAPTYAAPQPPTILSLCQAAGIVWASAIQAPTTGSYPPASMNLYRSPDAGTTWIAAGSAPVDVAAVRTAIADNAPLFATNVLYAATVVDSNGNESARGPSIAFQAFAAPPTIAPAANISAGALGNEPLLGSDIYLDAQTRQAAVGANGDFETVNGIDCLGQDLRIRMLTEIGQLALDPLFGILPLIGSAQASPVTQAQILRSDLLTALYSEPRVASVLALSVAQSTPMGWGVAYTVIAINKQDAANANQVWPYYNGGS